MDEELFLKCILSGGPISPLYHAQARQSSYREVHLVVMVPSQLHLQWVVGEEQRPEQLSPSPEVPLYFPHEMYQDSLDGSILVEILSSPQTPRRFFMANAELWAKFLRQTRVSIGFSGSGRELLGSWDSRSFCDPGQ